MNYSLGELFQEFYICYNYFVCNMQSILEKVLWSAEKNMYHKLLSGVSIDVY